VQITLNNIGKRYGLSWVFKGVDWQLIPGEKAAITGHNGSGKSTLLKIISGGLIPTKGTVNYSLTRQNAGVEDIIGQFVFVAPYIELVEEMTLAEHLRFHFKFLPVVQQVNMAQIILEAGLEGQEDKMVCHFSSGMKQRLKLAMAIFSDVPLLVLDEPTANLDESGVKTYQDIVSRYAKDKTIIVGSNQPHEYSFCTNILDITRFKVSR